MSVYNNANTINIAMYSILGQTYQNWELCVIDDGSNDSSLAQIRSFSDPRIFIVSDGSNKGLATRLNEAVSMSKGKYCARMDADDIMYPERIAEQVAWLEEHPEVDLLATRVMVFEDTGQSLGGHRFALDHKDICARPWDAFPLAHPSWMVKRDWLARYGYRPKSFMSEDQDLLLRAHKASNFACLPKILLGYRQASVSMKKEVRSRLSLGIDIFTYYCSRHQYGFAMLGIMTQLAKIVYSAIALLSGAKSLLSRRAQVVSQEERQRWTQVWSASQCRPSLNISAPHQ